MPNTYTLIESNTLSTSTAAITFSNIPATYTDLLIKISARMTTASTGEYIQVSFNGLTSNLNSRLLLGYSTAASSYDEASIIPAGLFPGSTTTASTFGNGDVYIPNYAGSTYKSVCADAVSENNSGTTNSAYAQLTSGLWSSTAAINSITLTAKTGSMVQHSTFYLYGIKNS
jgi:hypothetical protein